MTQLEQELIWLARKVEKDEDFLKRAEAYFRLRQANWSRGVMTTFRLMLDEQTRQLNFEQTRLEKITAQIIMERDANSNSRGKRLL